MKRTRHEVDVEYLSLRKPDTDEAVHLHHGQELPAWVPQEQVRELIRHGAVTEFGVI